MFEFPDGEQKKLNLDFSQFLFLRIMAIRQKSEELHYCNSSLLIPDF